ncbi:MAG: hypothetical protein D6743_11035, partial [Calditrichaeota bacterium]
MKIFILASVTFSCWLSIASSQPAPSTEFRATWVVDFQWIADAPAGQNQARTREILDNHRKANLNAVLWQVRRFGTVYYPS